MRRKILSLLITIGLAMSISIPIFAAPLTNQLSNQKKQLSEQQASYDKAQENFEKLEISIEMLDSDIESIYTGIDKAKSEIHNTEKKIEQTTKDIAVAEKNIKGEEDLFNKRIRAMFMNGPDSYLEILFAAQGLEDLISRVENVKKIIEYDNKIIKELNEKKKTIEDEKKSLNDNKAKVLALKVDNENKLDKLNIKKKEQNQLIVEAKNQEELHKNEITKTQALLGSTMNQIKEASNQTPKEEVAIGTKKAEESTPSRAEVSDEKKNETKDKPREETKVKPTKEVKEPEKNSSVSSNQVIAYAKNFLGTPYEWGAEGPKTFDCSGFTQYVYAHFGIATGRTTYDQIERGEYVSRENLQPGDLVFFGSGSPHHVGIYVGNGSYIHAPHTGDVVKISPLSRRDYLSARRFR